MFAHFMLAISYLWQWVSQQSPDAQTLEPAVDAVQRALALNDSLYWNHLILGQIYLYQQQYEQALAENAHQRSGGVGAPPCRPVQSGIEVKINN